VTSSSFSLRIASNGRPVAAIDDFSFVHNELTFLFGESGIGKSMLCKAVYGLLDPDELQISVNRLPYQAYLGHSDTRRISESSFFVFQEPSSHLDPLMKISGQLREGSIDGENFEAEVFSRLWDNADQAKLGTILDVFPKPYRPSGGEKQRVLLAMAFKKIRRLGNTPGTPTFFVFDEPTGSLDNYYRNRFLAFLFDEYRRKPFTAMVITHDYSMISEIYRQQRGLLDRVHFRELRRKGEGMVDLVDFIAGEYLDWLKSARPARKSLDEPVLQFSSRFSIFGQERVLFSDKERRHEADLVIRRGEMVYVKAPSGTGKTTLAKIVMGLYQAEKFSMKLAGKSATEAAPRSFYEQEVWGKLAGMVFQHADEALDQESTVEETFKGLPLGRTLGREELKSTLSGLFENGITDAFLQRKIKFLSGGQKQRLNLLRTVILHPLLIVLDEPLNGLDFDSVRKIIAMLDEKRKAGAALLLISHNEEIFDTIVDSECVYYLS